MKEEQRRYNYNILLLCIGCVNFIAFVIFAKYLVDISMCQFYIIFIIFAIFFIVYFIVILNLTKLSLPANNLKDILLLMTYFKELTLSAISFFYFTQVACNDTTPPLQFYCFLTLPLAFCLSGIFNCVLVDKFLFVKELEFLEFLFLFTFRLSYFVARVLGVIIFLSSISDSVPNIAMYLIIPIGILAMFFCNLIWYRLIENHSSIKQTVFESIKHLIDFNGNFFTNNKVLISVRAFKIKMNFVIAVIFGIVQIIIQVMLAFVWYFKAYEFYSSHSSKTTLFSLLSKTPSHISLLSLYQLRMKLKQRELELVIILGSMCISILSSFIYYNYYNNACIDQEKSLVIYQSKPSANNQLNLQNDGFSMSTYDESTTSISTSLSTSLFMRPRLKSFTLNRCSTCSSEENSAYLSRSFSELMITPIRKNGQQLRQFNYESSGNESSTNGSYSFISDQLKSTPSYETKITTTNGRIVCRNLFSEFTVNNLDVHNKHAAENQYQPNKILSWINQNHTEVKQTISLDNETYII